VPDLDLTVLACEAGRSSGYLLEHGPDAILVDCGPGVIRALEGYLEPNELTAIVITHEHVDHSIDLLGLAHRLRYPTPHHRRIPLYLPAGMADLLHRLDELFGTPTIGRLAQPLHDSFRLIPLELADQPRMTIATDLVLTAFPARHAVPSAALRFDTPTAALAFSSDTGPTPTLADAARNTNLFICEATYGPTRAPDDDEHGHLTATDAGQIANEAGADALLLTHMPPTNDTHPYLAAAATKYPGPIQIAARNRRYTTAPGAVRADRAPESQDRCCR
jgi:ribonuclease BN (tRNA processing enzyme)